MPADERNAKVYRSMWPLPGGHGRFLATLLEISTWVRDQDAASIPDLYAWMRQQYELGAETKTPEGYIQLISRMGYLETRRGGRVMLTDRGHRLLEAGEAQRAANVLDVLMLEWLGVYEVLEEVSRLGTANGKTLLASLRAGFTFWTSPAQYDWRLQWLHSLGCLEKAGSGYVITPRGQETLRAYSGRQPVPALSASAAVQPLTSEPLQETGESTLHENEAPDGESLVEDHPPSIAVVRDEADQLAERIRAAALESDDATAFERTIVEAFRFLGFEAEHKSGPGDTDVLVTAPLGQETYKAIVDGKSSRHGKVNNHQIDWMALKRHQANYGADYVLVVAPNFSSGDLLDNATKTEAALLSADDLAAVVRLHASTPLSLADLRDLFRYAGRPELPLQRVQEKASEVARLQGLLPDIIRTFEMSYRAGVLEPVSADALQHILARDYGRAVYSKDEIGAGLEVLCTALVGALRRVTDRTYALQMPITSVGRRFQAQARQLLDAAQPEPASAQRVRQLRRK